MKEGMSIVCRHCKAETSGFGRCDHCTRWNDACVLLPDLPLDRSIIRDARERAEREIAYQESEMAKLQPLATWLRNMCNA